MDLAQPSPAAQHVAVGEAAARRHALEVRQADAPGNDVAHVHVHRIEAGAVKAAAISTWPLTPCSRRIAIFGRVLSMAGANRTGVDIVAELGVQTGVSGIEFGIKTPAARRPDFAQLLHLVSGRRQMRLSSIAFSLNSFLPLCAMCDHAALVQAGHFMHRFQAGVIANFQYLFHILAAHRTTAPSSSLNNALSASP